MTDTSKKSSTTRSTAGLGYDFEDQVGAWLILKTFSGQPLPGIEGRGVRLQMQVEALNWFVDDLLLTAVASTDDLEKVAISCKSNEQVTAKKLPVDFVQSCWRQWTDVESNPFNRHKDRLMLVTRGRNNAFMSAWTYLKGSARDVDPALSLNRMTATETHRTIFNSVKDPGEQILSSVTDLDVIEMIDRMIVSPLDFQEDESEDQRRAIAESRSLVKSGAMVEGRRLWEELIAEARNARLGSGTIELDELWRRLRIRFELKGHPDYVGAWQDLKEHTEEQKDAIEVSLPTGVVVDRQDVVEALSSKLSESAVCTVFGESGSGKSALVKRLIDERFPEAEQVWLGPEGPKPGTGGRSHVSLENHTFLVETLDKTTSAQNFLVIDAVERLPKVGLEQKSKLVAGLVERNVIGEPPTWRIILIGQTQAWANGSLQYLAGGSSSANYELEGVPKPEVQAVLRETAGLGWLASDDDAIAALTNLRTLAWVVEAATQFGRETVQTSISLPVIAEKLWAHWTTNKPSVGRLLIRLAVREADFEHSFAISELESGDAVVLDNLPSGCPLRTNTLTGRIQFEHDLAADWARYQRLKEIADDTLRWAKLATNPLWHGALRMLGQLLLRREIDGRSTWDISFGIIEEHQERLTLALDVMLDSLFLDPSALKHLDERADMLLNTNGALLLRLVKRFEHIATVPSVGPIVDGRFKDLSLYIESEFREPIYSRWPVMAMFLSNHRDEISKLASPAIAGLCYRWLSSTPTKLRDGTPMPLRQKFANLALAIAREKQFGLAKGYMYVDKEEQSICQAALAAAPDLTTGVSDWALEMAERRQYRTDILLKVQEYKAERVAEHKQRLESDPEYRARQERLRALPTHISSTTPLPPWPIGPNRRVESSFRDTVLRTSSFQALMRADPETAGEVLLACVVEDEPEERYDSKYDIEHELGIEPDHDGYPTAPWKSQFYVFLQINTDAAIQHLHQLVNFCSDRWKSEALKHRGSDAPIVSLPLLDGSSLDFVGNYWVFNWSHQNSLFNGQLNSALAALEQWLCDQIREGIDVTSQLNALLQSTNSVAVLGVLVNISKHNPQLLKAVLRPLVAVQRLYEWDRHQVEERSYGFDALAWARQGEIVFEMAKRWFSMPYRTQTLRNVVADLIRDDAELGKYVLDASSTWIAPRSEKEFIEFQALVAELDYRNYKTEFDNESGETVTTFSYPEDVAKAIVDFQNANSRILQALSFPNTCRDVLNQSQFLNDDAAESVASLMLALDGEENIDIEDDMKQAPRVGAASLLLLRAPEWLARNEQVRQRAQSIVDGVMSEVSDEPWAHRGPRAMAPSHLEFVAYLVMERWVAQPSEENGSAVLLVLTSGDHSAVTVISSLAYRSRETLGTRWNRLLHLSLLWSGLSMLVPRNGSSDRAESNWQRWCRWFRNLSLSDESTLSSSLHPTAIAQRVERISFRRWMRKYGNDRHFERKPPRRPHTAGLDSQFLGAAFGWLLRQGERRDIPADVLQLHQQLTIAFWAHQAWWLSGTGDDEKDSYSPMSEFGYATLHELANLLTDSPAHIGRDLWAPVFALGPKGHYAIQHFLSCWFAQITTSTSAEAFGTRWRPMIEFLLEHNQWESDGPWFYRNEIIRRVLGFGASDSLQRMRDCRQLIESTSNLYRRWADSHLTQDEDELAGFCGFLSTEVGGPLRMDGLQWIADAMESSPGLGKWFRKRTGEALVSFLDAVLAEHIDELKRNESARDALISLTAHAVSKQLKGALTLQERAKRLL